MEDTKLPAGPGNTRSNIILNTNSYQLTSHNSLLKQQTSYDTKEKSKESSEKNEELKEDTKYTALQKFVKDNVRELVSDQNKEGSFPTGIKQLDDYALSYIATNFLFSKVKFLDKKLDLQYSEQKDSVSSFVLRKLPMRKDVNLETYWNEI